MGGATFPPVVPGQASVTLTAQSPPAALPPARQDSNQAANECLMVIRFAAD